MIRGVMLALLVTTAGCEFQGAQVDPRLEACDTYLLLATDADRLAKEGAFTKQQLDTLAAINLQQGILCDPARPAGIATVGLIAMNAGRVTAIIAQAGKPN